MQDSSQVAEAPETQGIDFYTAKVAPGSGSPWLDQAPASELLGSVSRIRPRVSEATASHSGIPITLGRSSPLVSR